MVTCYLDRDRTDLREWAKHKCIDFHVVHSSGHASRADLRRMAQAVAPRRLLPIHTVHPERYESLSANIEIAANGEWVTLQLTERKVMGAPDHPHT
jgi:ribonuclease J